MTTPHTSSSFMPNLIKLFFAQLTFVEVQGHVDEK